MRHLRRIICLILAGTLLVLTACNSDGKTGDAAKPGQGGRYVETDVSPPIDGRFKSFLASDGAIVCYNAGLSVRYESADGGGTWTESPGPGSYSDRYKSVSIGALLPDGRILAYIQDEGLAIITPDGGYEPYPIAEIDKAIQEGNNVMVSLLKTPGSDRLLISYTIGGMVIQSSRPIDSDAQDGSAGDSVIGFAPVGSAGSDSPADISSQVGNNRQSDQSSPGPDESAQQGSDQREAAPQNQAPQRSSGTQSVSSVAGGMTGKTLLIEFSTGSLIADIPVDNAMAVTADSESIYFMDMQGTIEVYSLADGSYLNKRSLSSGSAGENRSSMLPMIGSGGDILAIDSQGDLYALYDRNLLRCAMNGDVEDILEGAAYSIGTPNNTADSVLALADGSILVNMVEGMQANRLYRYTWDENAVIDPEKTLAIWSLEDNAFIRAAIAELRKKNPDSYITYEVAMSGDNAVSAADAIKTLNTRLLGGSGPDVIVLDGCPADSYAAKGMLLDISGLVDQSGIYQNLVAPYISDGKLYCLPMQFMMPALIGQADAIGKAATLEDLVNIVISGKDATVGSPGSGPFSGVPADERAELYFEDLDELIEIMWLSAAPAIVRNNRLDADALRRYLEAIKAISDKYGLADQEEENTMSMAVGFSSGGLVSMLPGSLVRYTSQITNYGAFAVGNLMLLQLMMERDDSTLMPFPGLVEGAWRPSAVTGISADTDVPGFAAQFLNTMLSIDVQRINYGAGLPVTREGIAEQMKEVDSNLTESGRGTFDIDIDALISKLLEPSAADSALSDMMRGSIENLCEGKTDVGGAVKEIEQNVKNYLAERT